METVKILQSLGLCVGSLKLTTTYNKKGELTKEFKFNGASWKDAYLSDNKKYNGFSCLTGIPSDIIVLDLDNMEAKECKEMKELAEKCCKMIVKTRKGYHYYFKYDEDFPNTIHGKNSGYGEFDIQSNGAYVVCPPTVYHHHETGEEYKYELLSEEPKICKMSKDLKNYINNLTKRNRKEEKAPKEEKNNPKMIESDDIIMKLINGLAPKRSVETDDWIKCAICLKNSKKEFKYFDYFSSLYFGDYDQKVTEKLWNKLKERKEADKKLSISTLWFWLSKDNPETFKKLKEEQYAEQLKIEIKRKEKFSYVQFMKYFENDTKIMGDDFYDAFDVSSSFKYYNNFHVYFSPHASIYRVGEDAPFPIKDDNIPNANIRYPVETGYYKTINFITLWKSSKLIKLISKFSFNPDPNYKKEEHDDEINLFSGFPCDEDNDGNYDMDIIRPYINHIKNVCQGEKKIYSFVLNWIAWLFQFPHLRTCSALVFYSETHGVGKNIIFDVIDKIMGKYYIKFRNASELDDRFNARQQNKILGVCDEVNARARDLENELKNSVSRNIITIEYKGKETYDMKDYCNYVFTTNNELVFRVPNTERRLMIIECCKEKMTKETIDAILDIMEDKDKLRQLYNYFRSRDISEFNPRNIITTDYKKELMKNDLPAYIKMVQFTPRLFAGSSITSKNLYIQSLEYARLNRLSTGYTERKCYKDIKNCFEKFYTKENDQRCYKFPENLEKVVDKMINEYITSEINK